MPDIAHSAHDMISGMTPRLRPGCFVFASITDPARVASLTNAAIAMFQEDEGTSLILPVAQAQAAGLDVTEPMSCITLEVFSSLQGVGLTAAVSAALSAQGIPCNMVAAHHHDHAFVPTAKADHALQLLLALQAAPPKDT